MYTINEITLKILEALESLKGSIGVKTIKLYEGQLETAEFMQTIDPTPIIYVVYTGSTFVNKEARQIQDINFMFFCVDKCLQSRNKIGIGGVNNPGIHKMIDGIRQALLNQMLGLSIYPFFVVSEDIIGYVKGFGIYAAHYKTRQAFIAPIGQ